MIHLFLEIPFIQQLEQLPGNETPQLHSDLQSAVNHKALEIRKVNSRTWVFLFPHIKTSHTLVAIQGLQLVWKVLQEWKEKILVFHGLVIASELYEDAVEQFSHIKLLIPRQNSFWADSVSVRILDQSFALKPWDGGIWEFAPVLTSAPPKPNLDSLTALPEKIGEQLADGHTSLFWGLAGQAEQTRTLYNTLLSSIVDNPTEHVLLIAGKKSDDHIHRPLLRALRLWYENHPLALDPDEHSALEFLRVPGINSNLLPVEPENFYRRLEDFFLNRLPGLLKGQKAFIIVDSYEHLSEQLQTLLQQFFLRFEAQAQGVKVIVTSNSMNHIRSISQSLGFFASIQCMNIDSQLPSLSERFYQLDDSSRLLVELCSALDGMVPVEQLSGCAEGLDISRLLVPQMLKDLSEQGFLYFRDFGMTPLDRIPRVQVCKTAAESILEHWKQGTLVLTWPFLHLVFSWTDDWQSLIRLGSILSLSSNTTTLGILGKILDLRGKRDKTPEHLYEALSRVFKAEQSLLLGNWDEAERGIAAIENIPQLEGLHKTIIEAYRKLLAARISYALGRLDTAIQEVKTSLMLFQQENDDFGQYLGMVVYGEILLGKNKLQDAKEYFQIAIRQAEDLGYLWLIHLSRIYEIKANFAQGYHSRTLQFFSSDKVLSRNLLFTGLDRWAYLAHFYWGRVLFLLGDYSQAEKVFREYQKLTKKWAPEWSSLFELWAARSREELRPGEGISDLEQISDDFPEKAYFLADAWVKQHNPTKAMEFLDTYNTDLTFDTHHIIWYPQPQGGFFVLEDHFIGFGLGHRVLENLVSGLKGLVLAKQHQVQEGAHVLFDLNRQRTLAAGDPYMHWYLSWYETVIELLNNTEYEAAVEDHNTVLGRAIKAMQERSSKIEDPAHRRLYMSSEIVNRNLIAKGRQHNLI